MKPHRYRFEGHAIVSTDGMIADASGAMPSTLMNAADWALFQTALDAAEVVVLGRVGHSRHPNPGRRRLVFTSRVGEFEFAGDDRMSLYFNPETCPIEKALEAFGIEGGTVAIAGGTRVFDYFASRFDCFVLSENHQLVLPEGVPCFSNGHPRVILSANHHAPASWELIDPVANVTQTIWRPSPISQT